MENWEIEVKEHWNKISDSEWYQSLRTDDRLSKLYNNPETAFHPEMLSLMKKYIGNFTGKRILLPSSGDNHAAFAFALMGAKVTSADISERQLENAKSVSYSWGLNIEYVCDNTMCLSKIDAAAYNLVYTSNGTLTLSIEKRIFYDFRCLSMPNVACPASESHIFHDFRCIFMPTVARSASESHIFHDFRCIFMPNVACPASGSHIFHDFRCISMPNVACSASKTWIFHDFRCISMPNTACRASKTWIFHDFRCIFMPNTACRASKNMKLSSRW